MAGVGDCGPGLGIAALEQKRFRLAGHALVQARVQNSTAWLKIEPIDLRPYTAVPFH
ncbi:MAG: hypothetical protein VKN13_03890 [Cyanobacteriota bacterium]|nr:hypothetical protein [Cyanobacteriota bacterium]